MSEFETVKLELDGPVAVVTLNRPEVLNAFNTPMLGELLHVVRAVNDNEAVRVAILTGEGRSFSAGADLSEDTGGQGFSVEEHLNTVYKPVLMAITEAPMPWISAVNGAAAGVGSSFAMNCDLTVMADDAYLYQAFAAIGLIPDGGATWHLARTIGRKRAYELIATGEKLRAERCLELGLCNRVVPAEQLLAETRAWAQELAGKAPLSLRYAKQALNTAMEADVSDTFAREAQLQHLCISSEDSTEGMRAFMQKRAPQFKGQ
jgi:2-(1,2-epoxy-1,2-dihydrophenyl)acetyl-CoA isomerase